MRTSRREFIGASLAALSLASAPLGTLRASSRKLRILFLGGTGFLGPHTVRYALERGHVRRLTIRPPRTLPPITAR